MKKKNNTSVLILVVIIAILVAMFSIYVELPIGEFKIGSIDKAGEGVPSKSETQTITELPRQGQQPMNQYTFVDEGYAVYVYGTGLVAKSDDGGIIYYHQDYLSSNRFSTNTDGELTSKNVQYPYGSSFSEAGTKEADTSYKFTGQEQDDDLYYYGARYYDPSAARFISIDPIYRPETSPYTYANNNPLRYIDPTGMAGVPSQLQPNELEFTAANAENTVAMADDTHVSNFNDNPDNNLDFLYFMSQDMLDKIRRTHGNPGITPDGALKIMLQSTNGKGGWAFEGIIDVKYEDILSSYDNFRTRAIVSSTPAEFREALKQSAHLSTNYLLTETHGTLYDGSIALIFMSKERSPTVGDLFTKNDLDSIRAFPGRETAIILGCEAGACGQKGFAQHFSNVFGGNVWADSQRTWADVIRSNGKVIEAITTFDPILFTPE
ncbi:RHS repeat-associated core domain-containing protein [Candidatus Aenigmatarchaeota archaeon]